MKKTKNVDLKKLAHAIMVECEKDGEPVTEAEALEMAQMEIKSGDISRYEKSLEPKKPRKPKERKIDEDKKKILSEIKCLLEGMLSNNGEKPDVAMKTETELNFSFKGNDYTLKLTKHRKKA